MACQLIGLARLGRDAELRYTTDNTPVASLSLAFSYGRKGESGKRPTQWVDASLWGKLAESLCEYLVKGSAVFVVLDDVHIQTFQLREGGEGHKLVGKVATIELAGGGQQSRAPAPAPASRPASRSAPQRQAPPKTNTGFDDMDDDIPF
jgi:single-strand DNA-binding protein